MKEDSTELIKAARKKLQRKDVSLDYIGYDDIQGHVWIVRAKKTQVWLARGWFGAGGDPHFSLFEDSE